MLDFCVGVTKIPVRFFFFKFPSELLVTDYFLVTTEEELIAFCEANM